MFSAVKRGLPGEEGKRKDDFGKVGIKMRGF